jgi:predicted GIY-YIG superfamily endonuclease
MFYFYILKCKTDKSLYCGSAKDLEERVKKHNMGKGSKYVLSRGGGAVVYKQAFRSWSKTLKREAEVKSWPRQKKLNLINTNEKSMG